MCELTVEKYPTCQLIFKLLCTPTCLKECTLSHQHPGDEGYQTAKLREVIRTKNIA